MSLYQAEVMKSITPNIVFVVWLKLSEKTKKTEFIQNIKTQAVLTCENVPVCSLISLFMLTLAN